MADTVRLLVDGEVIKAVRERGALHRKALRIFSPGQPEQRSWGATVCGELRVFRMHKDEEFAMEVNGDFLPGCPDPDLSETWPLKHVYIQQSRRHKYLNALVARCKYVSWYHHDIRVIGRSEIVYDLGGKGFKGMAQLWVQTRGKVIAPADDPWETPSQRKRWVSPDILCS